MSSKKTVPKELLLRHKLFTADTYKNVADTNDNIVISPFFAEVVIALTATGARGQTNHEILTALQYPYSSKYTQNLMKAFLPTLLSKSEAYQIFFHSRIYVPKDSQPRRDFKILGKKLFYTEVVNIDFGNMTEAIDAINEAVKTQTNHNISNTVEMVTIEHDTKMVLITALSLQGNWLKPFPISIVDQNFFKTQGDVVKVDMMQLTGHFNYLTDTNIKARLLEMRFEDETASMVVVLPFERDGLASVKNHIMEIFNSHSFTLEYVKVVLPKFTIESDIDFKEIMKKMGMQKAFTSEADFGGIDAKTYISNIIQRINIKIGEDGIELPPPVDKMDPAPEATVQSELFHVDHPFLFYIKIKGIIVFIGNVTHPEAC